MIQEIENDHDTHDPTVCRTCGNSGYVIQYIDGGRLVANVPCGCEQTTQDETDEDNNEAQPTDWWTAQGYWSEDVSIVLSKAVLADTLVALQAGLRHWRNFASINDRDTRVLSYEERKPYRAYARQRCREYILCLRQFRNPNRRTYL